MFRHKKIILNTHASDVVVPLQYILVDELGV